MRKIDELVRNAWLRGKNFKLDNTEIVNNTLSLHGNVIARLSDDGCLSISLAGWNTQVTRARLNAILPVEYILRCKKGKPYLNNVELDCNKGYTIDMNLVLEVV